LAEKKPEFIREYLPADANSLMAVMAETMASEEQINLIVSSKQPASAILLCGRSGSIGKRWPEK